MATTSKFRGVLPSAYCNHFRIQTKRNRKALTIYLLRDNVATKSRIGCFHLFTIYINFKREDCSGEDTTVWNVRECENIVATVLIANCEVKMFHANFVYLDISIIYVFVNNFTKFKITRFKKYLWQNVQTWIITSKCLDFTNCIIQNNDTISTWFNFNWIY